jgi:hypothetical protein
MPGSRKGSGRFSAFMPNISPLVLAHVDPFQTLAAFALLVFVAAFRSAWARR